MVFGTCLWKGELRPLSSGDLRDLEGRQLGSEGNNDGPKKSCLHTLTVSAALGQNGGVVVPSVWSWVGLILSRLMSRGKLPSLVQSG